MRAIILSGGSIKDYPHIKSLIKNDDMIICADRGYDHAVMMDITPHALVGDFDSIGTMPTDLTTITYPTKKDLTDTEAAIDYARGLGANDFLLLACTGTRMDHTITNILLLKGFLERGETAAVQDEHNKIMLTNSKLCMTGQIGEIVSLLPLETCNGVSTMGLEYALSDATMHVGKGLGVSNVMTHTTAQITIASGLMLVIQAQD